MRALLPLALMLPTSAFAQTTDVLWYHGNGGANAGAVGFGQRIDDFGGDLILHDDWDDIGSLGDYRFVVIARPTQDFSTEQKADLSAFVDNYGILVLLGDSALGATAAGLHAINDISSHLSLDMTLLDETFTNGHPTCVPGEVVNQTPFLDIAAPLNFESLGNIDVGGTATVVQTYSFFVQETGVTLTFTMMAHKDLVLMTADYQSFTADDCGIAAKETMWENVWDQFCDRDQDGSQAVECGGFDCDDTDPSIGNSFEWYDLDGDGYGDTNSPAPCIVGAVDNSDDCDDDNPHVNPLQEEVCDGVDNDCDLDIDTNATDSQDWYIDFDGDGFGRPGDVISSCDQPDDRVSNADDCDDGRDEVSPDATETCGNSMDDNCDGDIDEGCTPSPTGGGGNPATPGKKCSVGGLQLLGMPFLFAAMALTRRRERR